MEWYDEDPKRLEFEKIIMSKSFPSFKLESLEDGRLCWLGELTPGVYETKFGCKKSYHIAAVYPTIFTNPQHGLSICVYPIIPDADELIYEFQQATGTNISNYCTRTDSNNVKYLITPTDIEWTNVTAVTAISRTVSWLIMYELVLIGATTIESFVNAYKISY